MIKVDYGLSIMTTSEIRAELFRLRDEKYAALQAKIIPTLVPERIIGVRTPALRTLAKKMYQGNDARDFLSNLPHQYFDEDQLHAFIISLEKDFDKCVSKVEVFLPHIDNWATCDQLSPKVFKKQSERLLPFIHQWIQSEATYTVRFAIRPLMQHFLDEMFSLPLVELVATVKSQEYYIEMMIAWYFATALAEQYDSALPFFKEKRLDDWTHNKAIQKALESRRLTVEQKEYLKTLKIRRAIG